MQGMRLCVVAAFLAATGITAADAQDPGKPWLDKSLPSDVRADLVQAQMTRDEELTLVSGYFGVYNPRVPAQYKDDMPRSAGYVPGIPRLGIPALKETDASLGVANGGHMRPGDTAVALPASIMTTASWNPQIAYNGGAMIGAEARNKGFNVILAGGINLTREPRGGRTFEYSGEDPYLASVMVGESIRGIQNLNIISTIKHFALNDQETGRMTMSANIAEAAMRESDLLAFELAIERGDPGSVMCSYNRINNVYGCENDFLLNQVLKGDWGYKGFVMSDWGAVHSTVDAAKGGLDQQSSRFSDKAEYFGAPLKDAIEAGTVPETRLNDMVHRILRTMFAKGVFDNPLKPRPLNLNVDLDVAQRTAEEGIVLLKNERDLLPLDTKKPGMRRILVVGGFADIGVLSGGGSSQVIPIGYKDIQEMLTGGAVSRVPGEKPKVPKGSIVFHPPAPATAIRAEAPNARVIYYDGHNLAKAVRLARASDIVIVFAEQWMQEGTDNSALTLAGNQNELISMLAEANANTVVVLETGGPVTMPWLDKVGAVIEAWYSGNRGANAIARVLFGKVNPSGRLPVTFPQSESQLPRPTIPGYGLHASQIVWDGSRTQLDIDYAEGPNFGYKWFAQKQIPPLFAFGYGLSYTSFAYDGLGASGGKTVSANFLMRNTGARTGKGVAQIYVLPPGGVMRLVGFSKQELKPGEQKRVSLTADPRLLASFDEANHQWHIAAGDYLVMLASNAMEISASATVHLDEATIKP
jgi:beta-glucosidase